MHSATLTRTCRQVLVLESVAHFYTGAKAMAPFILVSFPCKAEKLKHGRNPSSHHKRKLVRSLIIRMAQQLLLLGLGHVNDAAQPCNVSTHPRPACIAVRRCHYRCTLEASSPPWIHVRLHLRATRSSPVEDGSRRRSRTRCAAWRL
jgi:hypothetical protein